MRRRKSKAAEPATPQPATPQPAPAAEPTAALDLSPRAALSASAVRRQRIAELRESVNGDTLGTGSAYYDALAQVSREIKELEEQDTAELREQLSELKMSALKKRLLALDVGAEQIEEVEDSADNAREGLIAMLVERLSSLDEELQALSLPELRTRVMSKMERSEEEVEEVVDRHQDNPKQALIGVLLGRDDWEDVIASPPPPAVEDDSATLGAEPFSGGVDGTPDWRHQVAQARDDGAAGEAPATPSKSGLKAKGGRLLSGIKRGGRKASSAPSADPSANPALLQAEVMLAADRIDGRPPVKEGYLSMGGVRRHFEMRSGCVLFFYADRGADLQGHILFADAIVMINMSTEEEGRHCFDVITPERLTYRLEASTKPLRDKWMQAVLEQQSSRGAMLRGSALLSSAKKAEATTTGGAAGDDGEGTPGRRGKTSDRRRRGESQTEAGQPPRTPREKAAQKEQERKAKERERRERRRREKEEARAEREEQARAKMPEPDPEPEVEPEAEPGQRRRRDRRGGGGREAAAPRAGVFAAELLAEERSQPPEQSALTERRRPQREAEPEPARLRDNAEPDPEPEPEAEPEPELEPEPEPEPARVLPTSLSAKSLAGVGGTGKYAALVRAYDSMPKQKFIVLVNCTYAGIKGGQSFEEDEVVIELIADSLEAVDEVDRDPIVGHLRNLLQKALKSSKVMKAQRAKRSADELFPRLQPLGFPDGCVAPQFCAWLPVSVLIHAAPLSRSFIRSFAEAFDQLEVEMAAGSERSRSSRQTRTPPRSQRPKGVTGGQALPGLAAGPSGIPEAVPPAAPSGSLLASAEQGVEAAAVGGAPDPPEVDSDVGAGTALLSLLAAEKKQARRPAPAPAPTPSTPAPAGGGDTLSWLSTRGSFSPSGGPLADALAAAPREPQGNGTAAPPAEEGAASSDDALGMFLALGK